MNIRKYFTKEIIKEFFISVTLDFVFITTIFLLMTAILNDGIPSNYPIWLSLIIAYSIGDSLRHVYQSDKVESVSELTKNNYWKLKNELNKKVNKKGRNGNR